MAIGEFAEPIYKLIDDLGGEEDAAREIVFNSLVRYLPGEEIERFVESFRRDYDLDESIVQTHFDVDAEDTTEDREDSSFFSSLIPEC